MTKIWIYCKECEKLVEKTAENNYICSNCKEPLLDKTEHKSAYINMNPFSRQTKMEINYSSHEDAIQRLKK